MTIQEKINIKSNLNELGSVRSFVRDVFSKVPKNKKNKDTIEKMVLAVNEAVTNIINHAYSGQIGKTIEITADISTNNIVFHLYDWGNTFSPESVAPPKLNGSESGGFGIHIMTNIVTKVSYCRDNDGKNCTRLEIKI